MLNQNSGLLLLKEGEGGDQGRVFIFCHACHLFLPKASISSTLISIDLCYMS